MSALFGSVFFLFVAVVAIAVFLHFVPLGLWISALAAGVRVGIFTLVGMRLRRVPPAKIVMPLIKANKAGLEVNVNQLEAHFLAGGNVDRVVDALIAAQRAQIPLPFQAQQSGAGRNESSGRRLRNPHVVRSPARWSSPDHR